jgi:hypothetical protein
MRVWGIIFFIFIPHFELQGWETYKGMIYARAHQYRLIIYYILYRYRWKTYT